MADFQNVFQLTLFASESFYKKSERSAALHMKSLLSNRVNFLAECVSCIFRGIFIYPFVIFVHFFIHLSLLIYSIIYSYCYFCLYIFIHWFCYHLCIYSFSFLFIYSPIFVFNHLLIHLYLHLFINPYLFLFIHLLIFSLYQGKMGRGERDRGEGKGREGGREKR